MLWNCLTMIAVYSIPLAFVAVPLGVLVQTIINYRRRDRGAALIFSAALALLAGWLVISCCMIIALYAAWHDPSGQNDTSAATVTLAAIYTLLGSLLIYLPKFLRRRGKN